jgi:hypothetical protein
MSTHGKAQPKPDLKDECIILLVGLVLLLVSGVLVQVLSPQWWVGAFILVICGLGAVAHAAIELKSA